MEVTSDYEAVPYPDFVHRRTNPDQIAAIGRLFGIDTAPPNRCRVLELGCGQGGNLLAMAARYPQSKFVGLDLSSGHICRARDHASECGLENVTFHAMDLADFESNDSTSFDYIIAHGVYSWVPREIAKEVLRIIHESLSPSGIAFVSYNTYPGWYAKSMIREVARYHAGGIGDPKQRISVAKKFLQDLAVSIPESSAYGRTLREEMSAISESDESYLFHELFEAINRPLHFHEFIDEISAASLHYLAEASLTFLPTMRMPKGIRDSLTQMPRLQREQHIDFFGKRSFRQSLLTRASDDMLDAAREEADPNAIGELWLSIRCNCDYPINLDEIRLEGAGDVSATVRNLPSRIVIEQLANKPGQSVAFTELWNHVVTRTADVALPDDAQVLLLSELLQLSQVGLVELHAGSDLFVGHVSERPVACDWARFQASRNLKETDSLASRRHEAVRLDGATRHLLYQCNGNNDIEAITASMVKYIVSNGVTMQHEGRTIVDKAEIHEMLRPQILPSLERLAESGFLIG